MDDYLPIQKSDGTTAGERLVAELIERTFLSLWSYPNPYWKRGKELCDGIVVFGDDVVLLAERTTTFKPGESASLGWKRWYREAVQGCADQVRVAEQRLRRHPDRIFLDRRCEIPFPIRLPPSEAARFHRVVVANGASRDRALRIDTTIQSSPSHEPQSQSELFTVGLPDSSDGHVTHVLDQGALRICVAELDTVSDFIAYLEARAQLFSSGDPIRAASEADLVASYIIHAARTGASGFSGYKPGEQFSVAPNLYARLVSNQGFLRNRIAASRSYAWDELVELFGRHLSDGSLERPETTFANFEQGLRRMAGETRAERRLLTNALREHAVRAVSQDSSWASRIVFRPPVLASPHSAYVFVLFVRAAEWTESQFTAARRAIMERYCLGLMEEVESLEWVVGVSFDWRDGRADPRDLCFLNEPGEVEQADARYGQTRRSLGLPTVGELIMQVRSDLR